MNVLIIGGAGFVGSNLVRWLLAHRKDWLITNLDSLTYAGNLENLADIRDNPAYQFVKGDIADPAVARPRARGESRVRVGADGAISLGARKG